MKAFYNQARWNKCINCQLIVNSTKNWWEIVSRFLTKKKKKIYVFLAFFLADFAHVIEISSNLQAIFDSLQLPAPIIMSKCCWNKIVDAYSFAVKKRAVRLEYLASRCGNAS